MNESLNETAWHHPWKEMCEACNADMGTKFETQREVLEAVYELFDKKLTDSSAFLGVHVVSLREKLIREGIYKKKIYKKKKRRIGRLRQAIRDAPPNAFANMTRSDLKDKFQDYSIIYITRLLGIEGRTYKKKWYWAKADKPKKGQYD